MKQYRLNVALGEHKAGDIVETNPNTSSIYYNDGYCLVAHDIIVWLKLGLMEEIRDGKEEWPKEGDTYWFVSDSSGVWRGSWDGDSADEYRRDTLGVYRTEQEAIARLEEIKALLKKE